MPKSNSEDDFGGSITSDEEGDMDAGPSSPVAASHSAQPEAYKAPVLETPRKNLKTDAYINPSSAQPVPSSRPAPTRSSRLSTASAPAGNRSKRVPIGSTLRGAARFKAAARQVMRMRTTSSLLGAFPKPGAEPGVDPRRASALANYGHVKEKCAIHVVDYSSVRSTFRQFNNKEFTDLLEEQGREREPWVKVRWIAIGGISWDVISTLALTYDLHPLSVEDTLHRRGLVRSKVDYLPQHLSLRILCHSLGDPDLINNPLAYPTSSVEATPLITSLPRSSSPVGMHYEDKDADATNESAKDMHSSVKSQFGIFKRKSSSSTDGKASTQDLEAGSLSPESRRAIQTKEKAIATIDQLKAGERVHVLLRNLFVFLLRDGTLISIHETPTAEFVEPILKRLRTRDTLLRTTADPSMLLESIIDFAVDQGLEVVEEYQKKIFKLERDILLKPRMLTVRYLHILSADLSMHKRTLGPLRALVYGLRRYDSDRCLAVTPSSAGDSAEVDAASHKVVGYMSHKSKVYLADVLDHVDYILSSLDMFAGISENLINYTFNMANYQMGHVMRRLTLATIIFLPLTLLTGYFGMNFENQWSVHNNSDVLFWEIAIPVMAVVITSFMWSDIMILKNFLEKKMDIKRIDRTH